MYCDEVNDMEKKFVAVALAINFALKSFSNLMEKFGLAIYIKCNIPEL